MLFGHKDQKKKLQVALGDYQDEKGRLFSFLESHLKVKVIADQNTLIVDSETLSPQELQRVVTKFIYHQNLNGTHWASVEGSTVKINKFKNPKKPEKHKKTPAHQTLTQSWGL